MLKIIALTALAGLIVAACARAWATDAPAALTRIKSDETIVFFSTTGWYDEDADVWHLPIHGWVYEPQDSSIRKAAIRKALAKKYALQVDAQTQDNFARRINLMIADNERGKTIVVRLLGRDYVMPRSRANGHFETTLQLPGDDVRASIAAGHVSYSVRSNETPVREFAGVVFLVPARGVSVISDIDDTIKLSHVTDHKKLFEQTFYRDFEAVPGMAAVYSQWAKDAVSIHYVSSSPWQLYTPLAEFLDAAGFPAGTFNLKRMRFRDRTFFNLFKKGTQTKPLQIETILQRYPSRRFVLIGDSGEQDPEVYAAMLRKHPQQVRCAYIRNVTGATRDDARMRAVFDGIDADRWALFDDPATLALPPAPVDDEP